MAGIRNTMPLQELEELNEPAYQKLLDIMATLVRHYRICAMSSSPLRAGSCGCCRRGWASVPPPRSGSPPSSLDEGVISMDEALGCASGAGPAELMFPRFDEPVTAARLATGMGASPGAAVGRVVFDSQSAVAQAAKGEAVILVRTETNPDDLPRNGGGQGHPYPSGGQD